MNFDGSGEATFEFSSSEAGSSFQCRVDAPALAPCSSPYITAALDDGQHTFEVRATDGTGNMTLRLHRAPSRSTRPARNTIDSGPTGTVTGATPRFTFSASEPGWRFDCKVDTAMFAVCSSPLTIRRWMWGRTPSTCGPLIGDRRQIGRRRRARSPLT